MTRVLHALGSFPNVFFAGITTYNPVKLRRKNLPDKKFANMFVSNSAMTVTSVILKLNKTQTVRHSKFFSVGSDRNY